jgi:hypothetical protein
MDLSHCLKVMRYSEAKQVLEKAEKAKAVLESFQKVSGLHQQFGFKTRRDFIKALKEIDRAEGGNVRGAGTRKAKGRVKSKGRGPRGLSPETVEQIKKLKSEGKSNAEISRTVGVSPLTVAKYVKGSAAKAEAAPAPAKAKVKARKPRAKKK